ncbi:enoyl-CoA hydratase/isomerase family protein [Paraburkholderia caballeronis]|uniref:enoyl-CoA hydratase/isomerase family protein n=1 Tax=Paraburkholderia caballeronis TaxID=416943 RepID=UPI0010650AD5|nr:enoyl-CoA hydratase/isomerase family protein [Paraburkholderia caballeronis]TDV05487.1 enoyl-CoA hydratase/carnithine racemase [Paraburkholderia caballeronis]TDV09114.1 enoyl-CoA hydratase/carnithine racemase [Paraburkholderia caballeronis]TDV20234.1 enoyl-CoA hydratase/carnithine racemase [Paraburkholderia caballeronis]
MIDTLLAEQHGPILVLTLNKPQKLNAIDADMLIELALQIEAADMDDTIAVTVIRGAGRAFSTGFDMSAGGSTEPAGPRLRANLERFLTIWRARKPVVAAVDGYALGAGFILANLCDFVYASERATFGEPEIRYWNPASITILPWIVGVRRAKQLLFFGRPLDARTALDWGLVNDVLPDANFFETVLDAVRPLTHLHPDGVAALKRSINGGFDIAGFVDALRAGVDAIAPLYEPDAPAKNAARAEVERLGFKAYIRHRDSLLGN